MKKSMKSFWIKYVNSVGEVVEKLRKKKILALLLALILVALIINLPSFPQPPLQISSPREEKIVEVIIDQALVDDYPFIRNGVVSWTQLLIEAPPELLEELGKKGLIMDDIKNLARKELENNHSFLVKLPVGTKIRNSYLKNGKVFWYSGYLVKDGDQFFLADKQGKIWLKASCANPVIIPEPSPPCPPPRRRIKESINSSPRTTPHHRNNPSTQPAQPKNQTDPEVRKDLEEKTAPTPGYTPGNVEETKKNHATRANIDTNEGAKTPTGSTVLPNGSTIHAPKPSPPTESPAPPPPKAETNGAIFLP